MRALRLFEFGLAIFLFGFEGGFRAGDAFGQFGGLFLGGGVNGLVFGADAGAEFAGEFFLPGGKILEGAFEPVQKREHFIGSQMPIHSRA